MSNPEYPDEGVFDDSLDTEDGTDFEEDEDGSAGDAGLSY